MSCEKGPNKIARLAGQVGAGIVALASKRSFYAGVAVGAGGAMGGMALATAIHRRQRRNGGQSDSRQPVLTAGGAPEGTQANPRPIPKEALQEAPGTRTNPRKIPPGALQSLGTRANPVKIPVLSPAPAETKLQAASIRIQTGSGQSFTPTNSYRVVRPDGSDTGLAVTPYVRESEPGQLVEDDQSWGVTHAASGSLISGPYGSVGQAQGLATQLSGLRWNAARMPAEDVTQARQIVSAYRRGRQGEDSELRTGSE